MKTKRFSGAHSLIMLLLVILSLTVFASGADTQSDQLAFGSASIEAEQKLAWTNDALSQSEIKALLNQQELHPQETGWDKLDALLDQLLTPYRDQDTYTQLRAIYDYLVTNVTYSWEGYSKQTAPAYEYFTRLDYLKDMTYEEGLQKSIPDDMANRAYHTFYAKRGVCYDYAIAFAVAARYIGIDSYVHTGYFIFEDTKNGSGHHGWSLLTLNGANYVFDPQRDARNWQYHGQNGYYFGIPLSAASRYLPDYNKTANASRDASMLSVTATRARRRALEVTTIGHGTVQCPEFGVEGQSATLTATPDSGYAFLGWYDQNDTLLSTDRSYTFTVTSDVTITAQFGSAITLKASRSGSVTGGGTYSDGTEVMLSAQPDDGHEFQGWYSLGGTLLSESPSYTITASGSQTIVGMFQGDCFYDISSHDWFLDNVIESVQRGMVAGTSAIAFSPGLELSRGQVVAILARMEHADTASIPAAPFTDVNQSAYYAPAINWAYANAIVAGVSDTQFAPDAPITRQDLIVILIHYLTESRGLTLDSAELTFTDAAQIKDYAQEPIQKALSIGLIYGYPDGSFQPDARLFRCDGVSILVRLARYLETIPTEPENPEPSEEPEVIPSVSPEPAPSSEPSESPAPSATPTPEVSPTPAEAPTEPTVSPTPSSEPSPTPSASVSDEPDLASH